MNPLFIYLSGSIKKGNRTHVSSFWGDEELALIEQALGKDHYCLLNPAVRSDDLSDIKSTFGRDMLQVFLSDILIVDGREKRGVGVGAEMLFARQLNTPVFTMIPTNSHYHADEIQKLGQTVQNWTHPFMFNLSNHIGNELLPILREIKANIANLKTNSNWARQVVKDQTFDFIFDAMRHYLDTQLKNDTEMYRITRHEKLLKKIEIFKKIS